MCSKASRDNSFKLGSYLHYFLQIHHHYFYTLLINNTLISFDHPLGNLKHITFLTNPLYNVSKSFQFCFAFDLVNSGPSFYICF